MCFPYRSVRARQSLCGHLPQVRRRFLPTCEAPRPVDAASSRRNPAATPAAWHPLADPPRPISRQPPRTSANRAMMPTQAPCFDQISWWWCWSSVCAPHRFVPAAKRPSLPGRSQTRPTAPVLLLSPDTWTNSEAQAVAMGGTLAIVPDAGTNSWIVNTFAPYINSAPDANLWIGLYDPTGAIKDDGPGGPGSLHAADFVWLMVRQSHI